MPSPARRGARTTTRSWPGGAPARSGQLPPGTVDQVEPVAEPGSDLGHGQRGGPTGGELDGERQPVELAAELGDLYGIELGGAAHLRPVDEEVDGCAVSLQRSDRNHPLPPETERPPAAHEDPNAWRPLEQSINELRHAVEHVLGVVQDQQRM